MLANFRRLVLFSPWIHSKNCSYIKNKLVDARPQNGLRRFIARLVHTLRGPPRFFVNSVLKSVANLQTAALTRLEPLSTPAPLAGKRNPTKP
jgi:hypothetical protein